MASFVGSEQGSSVFTFPNFEHDRDIIARYEAELRWFEIELRRKSAEAVQLAHRARYKTIANALAETRELFMLCDARVQKAIAAYQSIAPRRVVRDKIRPPRLVETMLSLGRANLAFHAAAEALRERERLASRRRKLEEQRELNALDMQTLSQQFGDQGATSFDPTRDPEFLEDPNRRDLYLAVERIRAERQAYEARLDAGAVTTTERRLRSLAERGIPLLTLPITAALIIDIEVVDREAHYIVLGDDGARSWLPYEPALHVLMETVFSATQERGSIEVTRARGRGTEGVSVLGFISAAVRDVEVARKLYQQQRKIARMDLVIPPCGPQTPSERDVVRVLLAFVQRGAFP